MVLTLELRFPYFCFLLTISYLLLKLLPPRNQSLNLSPNPRVNTPTIRTLTIQKTRMPCVESR